MVHGDASCVLRAPVADWVMLRLFSLLLCKPLWSKHPACCQGQFPSWRRCRLTAPKIPGVTRDGAATRLGGIPITADGLPHLGGYRRALRLDRLTVHAVVDWAVGPMGCSGSAVGSAIGYGSVVGSAVGCGSVVGSGVGVGSVVGSGVGVGSVVGVGVGCGSVVGLVVGCGSAVAVGLVVGVGDPPVIRMVAVVRPCCPMSSVTVRVTS